MSDIFIAILLAYAAMWGLSLVFGLAAGLLCRQKRF